MVVLLDRYRSRGGHEGGIAGGSVMDGDRRVRQLGDRRRTRLEVERWRGRARPRRRATGPASRSAAHRAPPPAPPAARRCRPPPPTSTSGSHCRDRAGRRVGNPVCTTARQLTAATFFAHARAPALAERSCRHRHRRRVHMRMHMRLRQDQRRLHRNCEQCYQSGARSTPKEAHSVSRAGAHDTPKTGASERRRLAAATPHRDMRTADGPQAAVSQAGFSPAICVPRLLDARKFGNLTTDISLGDLGCSGRFSARAAGGWLRFSRRPFFLSGPAPAVAAVRHSPTATRCARAWCASRSSMPRARARAPASSSTTSAPSPPTTTSSKAPRRST